MKLAAYYKKKKEVVVLAPQLEPERYQKMYVVKDYFDGNFDKRIFLPNVEYHGHAFTKDNYISLPEEIELCRPDKYLYHKFENLFCTAKKKRELFTNMTNAEHIRLSLDGKTIWDKFDSNLCLESNPKTFIFHDYDLGKIQDSYLAVKDIIDRANQSNKLNHYLGTKFPIQVSSENQLYNWLHFIPSDLFYTIQYNNLFEDEVLNDIIKINPFAVKKIWYNVTSTSFDENHFIKDNLSKIFRQVLFLRSRNIPILLVYDDNFFKDKRWERLIKLFNCYIKVNKAKKIMQPGFRDFSQDFTLFRYIKTKNFFKNPLEDWFTLEEIRELFQLVREKNYETFKMFYESCIMELKGGKIDDTK
jgi:hypothetical protein